MVGRILRSHWGDRFALRLADVNTVKDPAGSEGIRVDITTYDEIRRACERVDTVVHLAADPDPESDFYEKLLPVNVVGAYNTFRAAHEAGCRRIVFASSVHVVLGRTTTVPVSCDSPVDPASVYGATKCWGEALGRFYAQRGLSCICVRLGNPRFCQSGDWDPDEPSWGISPGTRRDCSHSAWRFRESSLPSSMACRDTAVHG